MQQQRAQRTRNERWKNTILVKPLRAGYPSLKASVKAEPGLVGNMLIR